MKATIYCRVSTEDQEREGTSLHSQLEACEKLAQDKGYEVPEDFIAMETYSGLSLDRPKLNEMRQRVRDKEVDAVIAYTLDRLSRDPVHFIILQEELERNGCKLFFAIEDIDSSDLGKLITYIKGYAAKLEAEKIRERSNRGMRQRALAGKLFTGKGTKLYGYNYIAGKGEGEGIRYINEDEACWVKNIFKWYVEDNLTIGGIARRLSSLDVLSPSGKSRWCSATVWNILKNEGYVGKTYAYLRAYDQRIELCGATPPIIDENLFNRAQQLLKRNKELASRNTKRDYLLRGYAFCKLCGRRYNGATLIKRNGKRYQYYKCSGVIKSLHCPSSTWASQDLDRAVWQEVEKALTNPEVIVAGLESIADTNVETSLKRELQHVQNRLDELDREQEQLLQWALKGFPEETIIRENERMNSMRADLLRRGRELETRIEQASQANVDVLNIKEACKLMKNNLMSSTIEGKRQALEALRVKVWIDKDCVTLEGYLPVVSISGRRFW